MKVISFGLQKGGTAKTTSSTAAAIELAKYGNVLLVDGDPQGNATASLVESYEYEFADVLFDKVSIADACIQTKVENLYLLATSGGQDLREYKANKASNEIWKIDDIFKSVEDNFDYIIVDTSPDFSAFEQNIFMASTEIIPVINADVFAFDGLTMFLKNLEVMKKNRRVEYRINNIILSKYNASLKLDTQIKESTEKNFSNFNVVVIPQDQNFKVSQFYQQIPTLKKNTQESLKKLVEFIK